ncbi:MAG: hypothetical protein Kow0010_25120 [Dehalococcoidia bacterium]
MVPTSNVAGVEVEVGADETPRRGGVVPGKPGGPLCLGQERSPCEVFWSPPGADAGYRQAVHLPLNCAPGLSFVS